MTTPQIDDLYLEFTDVEKLSPEEQMMIMPVRHNSEAGRIERYLRRVFLWAICNRCSDIHIEGRGERNEPDVFIHVRSPGGLVNMSYTGKQGKAFEEKLFQLTGTPQGGSTASFISTRFSVKVPNDYARKKGLSTKGSAPYLVDVRVEYTKTFDGFAFVCRLLDQQNKRSLSEMGLTTILERAIKKAALEPSGLLLVTGPTGSGKSTLLNAILSYLNDGTRSITTLENPVEFTLEGMGPIKQISIKGEITFAQGLRSTLRQDPDVILVGEIRDAETMEIALQAAQTGHIVLATVHSNNTHETFPRLEQLGADPFILADNLKMVIAQRLIKIYSGHPVERQITRDERSWLDLNGLKRIQTISEPPENTWFGKIPIIEALVVDDGMKQHIRAGKMDSSAIYKQAREQLQYESLASAGVRAVQQSGAKLRDCMASLESNTDAKAYPGRRIKLANECNGDLKRVSAAIDRLELQDLVYGDAEILAEAAHEQKESI